MAWIRWHISTTEFAEEVVQPVVCKWEQLGYLRLQAEVRTERVPTFAFLLSISFQASKPNTCAGVVDDTLWLRSLTNSANASVSAY